MPEVVEKKRWDDEHERYIVTHVHQITRLSGDQERVASSDLLTYVLEVPIARQTTPHTMRLANVMKVLGWQRTSNGKVTINGQQVRGYFRWIEPSSERKGSSRDALLMRQVNGISATRFNTTLAGRFQIADQATIEVGCQ